MNKKEFLSILEKRLSILNEDERQDIINEYKDTISEKVKNGQTEEEAIHDFGNIDDLVKELLSAYKIDPDFENKEKSSFDNILDESENLVKKGANKLAEFTKNLYHRFESSNKEINLSLMFEILIKIFLLVLALALLRLPFILFEELGERIFEALFSPIDNVLSFVWKVCLMVLYIVFCVLISIATFKKYFTSEGIIKENAEEESKKNSKDEISSSKSSEKLKKEKSSSTDHTTIGDICLLIIKLFVVLFVIVPLAFLDAFALFGLIVSVFYFIKGINLLGLSILLLGAVMLITYLIKLLFNLVFSKKKIIFIPAVIGIILVTVGSIMFFDMVMNIDYIDASLDTNNMDVKEEIYTIDKDVIFGLHYYCNGTKVVDNTMADNQVKVKVTYDKSYHDVTINFDNNYQDGYCHEYNSESCSYTAYNYISTNLVNNDFDNLKKIMIDLSII